LSIFFFAFLPQFVSAGEPHPLAHMAWLSLIFMLLTFVVFVGYGLFAASIRTHVISRPRVLTWMRRTFAAAFVALGAKLALAERLERSNLVASNSDACCAAAGLFVAHDLLFSLI